MFNFYLRPYTRIRMCDWMFGRDLELLFEWQALLVLTTWCRLYSAIIMIIMIQIALAYNGDGDGDGAGDGETTATLLCSSALQHHQYHYHTHHHQLLNVAAINIFKACGRTDGRVALGDNFPHRCRFVDESDVTRMVDKESGMHKHWLACRVWAFYFA